MIRFAYVPSYFEPTDEFYEILGNRIGVIYDKEVINYIENHSIKLNGRNVCKGKETCKFKIGFAGCCEILEADDTKTWTITCDCIDRPKVKYVSIHIDEHGHVIKS